MSKQDRRSFIQQTALAGAAVALPSSTLNASKRLKSSKMPKDKIRMGFIGTGFRGQSHMSLALNRSDVEIVAFCDIDPVMIQRTQNLLERKKANTKPVVYDQGPYDYIRMLEQEALDAVIISTPWRLHTEMAVASMKAGIYTGVEVCGAFSIEECWDMVRTHEETGSHLFFLENVFGS